MRKTRLMQTGRGGIARTIGVHGHGVEPQRFSTTTTPALTTTLAFNQFQ
jgi:hypothetical protein